MTSRWSYGFTFPIYRKAKISNLFLPLFLIIKDAGLSSGNWMEKQIENLLGIYNIQLVRIIIRPGPKNGYMELHQSWEKAGKGT